MTQKVPIGKATEKSKNAQSSGKVVLAAANSASQPLVAGQAGAKPGGSSVVGSSTASSGEPERGEKKIETAALIKAEGTKPPINSGIGNIPRTIGSIRVLRQDNLSTMIRSIYGEYTNKLAERVLEVNPDVPNRDTLSVGQTVHFPALTFVGDKPEGQWFFIELGRFFDIDSAYSLLRGYRTEGELPAVVVSFWSLNEGLVFSVVINKYFQSRPLAQFQLGKLGGRHSFNPKVTRFWRSDAIYFSRFFMDLRKTP